jgi:carbamate kinase
LAAGNRLLITFGNGPQVGHELLRVEAGREQAPPATMDLCVAATQGTMGYLIEQALRDELAAAGIERDVATLITQAVVDPTDTAFQHPTKPVGPFFSRAQAEELMPTRGWRMVEDSQRGYRRVVPSPRPIDVLGIAAINALLAAGQVVIAGGGGGIPVMLTKSGIFQGVEAVIDKDWTASLIARRIGARSLIQLTAVDCAFDDFGTAAPRPLGTLTVAAARELLAAGHFPPGSMGPKVESCCEFVESSGDEALITPTEKLTPALQGRVGTRLIP